MPPLLMLSAGSVVMVSSLIVWAPCDQLPNKRFQQRGSLDHGRHARPLAFRVGTAADGTEAVQRRDAECSGEVAVRAAADRCAVQRTEAEILCKPTGEGEQVAGCGRLERRSHRL